MTEFGSTLQAFIRLADFKNQSAYALAAGVADSTVTRSTSGKPFSPDLLSKLIKPFPPLKQVELVRAYIRDRLNDGVIPEKILAAALGNEGDALARFRPETRLMALRLAASAAKDPAFHTTLENLLKLIGE